MIKFASAALALSLLAAPAAASPNERTAHSGWSACKSLQVFNTLLAIAGDNDVKAFKALLVAGVTTGECILLKDQMTVFVVEDQDERVCVRPKGKVQCYWTVPQSLTE
jgi:hypothetical protein